MRLLRTLAAVMVVLGFSAGAFGQENLEQGKSGAQLYASDCAICHKSPQALIKEGYPTEGFLRVHYTSSREMAAALFTYLRGMARADAAASGTKRVKKRASSSEKNPAGEKKASSKATGAKAGEANAPGKKEKPAAASEKKEPPENKKD
jgi:hypothetical protein